METRCSKVDTSNYTFGLLCMLDSGAKVRHDFGKGSFDPEEVFDTFIACHKCWGPEETPDLVPKSKDAFLKLAELHDEVNGLTSVLAGISKTVSSLNNAIFKARGAPAPAAAPAPVASLVTAPAVSSAKVSFLDQAEALVTRLSHETEAKTKAKDTEHDEEQDDID